LVWVTSSWANQRRRFPAVKRNESSWAGEVDRVFDVTLAELLSDGVHREERWELFGAQRAMHFFDVADETVWGATARILAGFLAHLTGVELSGDRSPADGPLVPGLGDASQ
jgi:hypothetical protein